tara:strand:+ start:3540 stop:3953 length:414 start_codon:yes stop_codon:yes gene_type:complete
MDDLTDEQIEAYLKQRKVKAKQSKAKVVIKIEEKIVLDDLVDEIITTYTEAQKRAIYKHRAKNKENYNNYTREYTQRKMTDPDFARRKKEATAKSNEKVRLRKLAEREALEKKIRIIKTEHSVPDLCNVIIETNNGN